MDLRMRPETPLFGVISRLTPQKGLDLLAQTMERVLGWDLQIVLLGSGDSDAERFFSDLSTLRKERFRARIGFDNGLAHRIEAGCDFFLMPSRFEPCGLNQMYSLRYGTPPIVHATGGLADTVTNYDESTGSGTGFVIYQLNAGSLADTIGWALSTYFDHPRARKPCAGGG
jgi:starch synthase